MGKVEFKMGRIVVLIQSGSEIKIIIKRGKV